MDLSPISREETRSLRARNRRRVAFKASQTSDESKERRGNQSTHSQIRRVGKNGKIVYDDVNTLDFRD